MHQLKSIYKSPFKDFCSHPFTPVLRRLLVMLQNRSQIHCLNLTFTLTLPLDPRCVYSLKDEVCQSVCLSVLQLSGINDWYMWFIIPVGVVGNVLSFLVTKYTLFIVRSDFTTACNLSTSKTSHTQHFVGSFSSFLSLKVNASYTNGKLAQIGHTHTHTETHTEKHLCNLMNGGHYSTDICIFAHLVRF